MRKTAGMILLILFGFEIGFGQHEGAASAALGGATVALGSEFSAAGNPAGMTSLHALSVGADISQQFMVKELGYELLCLTIPAGKCRIGGVFGYTGYDLYSEITTGVACALQMGKKFSAGIRIDYLRTSFAEGYSSDHLFSFRIGLLYRASQNFTVGFLLANPYPVKIADDPGEYLPVSVRTGIAWNLSKNLVSVAEIGKDLKNPLVFRAGLEYHLVKPVYARAGLITSPARFTFGFGIGIPHLKIDICSSYHPVLGYSPEISFIYSGRK